MTLSIRSLNTRWRSAQPLPAQRVQAWVDSLAAQDGDAITAGLAQGDEWVFVRELPLQLRWRADADAAEVGATWQASLAAALRQAVAAPGSADAPQVLRYAHRHDALADLLYRSALGETQRQWAWQRMGLLPRQGVSAAQALEQGTALLLGDAPAVWPVLARLWAGEADCASLSALLRGWSAARWHEVLRASPVTRPYLAAAALTDGGEATEHGAPPAAINATARALLGWARARPQLVAGRSQAVAALLAALMGPGAPPAAGLAAQRLRVATRLLREAVRPAGEAADVGRSVADPRGARTASTAEAAAPVARERGAHEPALPPLPTAPAAGLPTRFGGLLFWLAQLPRLGVVRPAADAPGPLALLALARALGVPDDDPASAAFCGGSLPEDEVPAEVTAAAQAHANVLTAWLDEAAPDLPAPRMAAVCQRAGQLHIAPGWIELRLPLASVDTAVRRLGLDLDPGWLPWLGCVVSIHYED